MQMSAAGVGFDNDWITSTDEQNTLLIPLFPAWPDNDYDKDRATTKQTMQEQLQWQK